MSFTKINSLLPGWYSPMGGERFIVDSTNLIYVSIPKNAHTWIVRLITDSFGCRLESHTPQDNALYFKHDTRFVVVLRDPIDRWVSGFAEFFSVYEEQFIELLDNTMFQELVFDTLHFDDHTNSQLIYFENLAIERCVFFNMSDDLEYNLMHYFSTFNRELISNSDFHAATSYPYKLEIMKKLRELLTHAHFMDKLLEFTKHDRAFMQYLTEHNLWYTAR